MVSDSRPDYVPEATYANVLEVGHTAFEFLLDFRQSYPTGARELSAARVVTGPAYAKAMMKTLEDSITRYEAAHGPIPPLEDEESG